MLENSTRTKNVLTNELNSLKKALDEENKKKRFKRNKELGFQLVTLKSSNETNNSAHRAKNYKLIQNLTKSRRKAIPNPDEVYLRELSSRQISSFYYRTSNLDYQENGLVRSTLQKTKNNFLLNKEERYLVPLPSQIKCRYEALPELPFYINLKKEKEVLERVKIRKNPFPKSYPTKLVDVGHLALKIDASLPDISSLPFGPRL
ncbi:hypothetical protein HDU92_008770 [Lobulomyces angularis]|nr:hypothetical protein HDU92_008770 [Lobulomyces angularis]